MGSVKTFNLNLTDWIEHRCPERYLYVLAPSARLLHFLKYARDELGIENTDQLAHKIKTSEKYRGDARPDWFYRIPNVGKVTWRELCWALMRLGYGNPEDQTSKEEKEKAKKEFFWLSPETMFEVYWELKCKELKK